MLCPDRLISTANEGGRRSDYRREFDLVTERAEIEREFTENLANLRDLSRLCGLCVQNSDFENGSFL